MATTEDGWKLALHRYPPVTSEQYREPVILCHGFATNRFSFDLDEEHSMARYLNARGFDVWLVEFRGHGASDMPGEGRGLTYGWSIDDYITKDLPAILDEVRSLSGSDQVSYLGHSTGGCVMYAYLATSDPAPVKNFIAVASPIGMGEGSEPLKRFISIAKNGEWALNQLGYLPVGTLAASGAPFTGMIRMSLTSMFFAPENFTNTTMAKFSARGVDNVSSNVCYQWLDWIENHTFRSFDRTVSYTDLLAHIDTPIFVLAGSIDATALYEDVRRGYERVSSQDKTFRVFGRSGGDEYDYCHDGLCLGKGASDEVYPAIARWLEERSTPVDGG